MSENIWLYFYLGVKKSSFKESDQLYNVLSNLDADDNDEGRGGGDSEGLIIGERNTVALCGPWKNSIRHKEQHHRGVDTLSNAN